MLRRVAAMSQRLFVERMVARRAANQACKPRGECRAQKPSPIRSNRAALGQVQGLSMTAEPVVE
jgi:hypothetical protein